MKHLLFAFIVSMGLVACNKDNNCEGNPDNQCACPEIYAPVCGCDDVTYGNSCEAECAGITDYTEGACN